MRLPRVAIIDYGMGNLYSVLNALAAVGVRAKIVGTPDRLSQYDKLILFQLCDRIFFAIGLVYHKEDFNF